jgi:negative regulator of genetic competence, sporulation and motility
MKIERVNDHQIRCTLTKKELEKRDLKLSDMSYGNEKVKRLFQDMMQMAAYECDFEAEDTPLMIEVIPFTECAVVIITKVEDPDELDTRFSRFAPSVHDGEPTLSGLIGDVVQSLAGNGEEIAELFKKMQSENIKVEFLKEDEIQPVKNHLKAHLVKITKDGKSVNAVIARSFARQDIGRAYDVMVQYGKLCFELLKEN